MTIPEMIELARELDVVFLAGQDPEPLVLLGTYQGVPILGHASLTEGAE